MFLEGGAVSKSIAVANAIKYTIFIRAGAADFYSCE